jgi:RNA polymerase sigma-70 factor, ECF subfamily
VKTGCPINDLWRRTPTTGDPSFHRIKWLCGALPMPDLHTNPAAPDDEFDRLLAEARAGSEAARNELFAHIQKYLGYVAGQHYNPALAGKLGVSDVVQQTMLHAAGEFSGFRGTTAEEFRGWLRQILINEVRGANRHFSARRRNAAQEVGMETGQSGDRRPLDLADSAETPSMEISAGEESRRLQKILEKMPEDMRLVVQLRNWDGLQFNEIAQRMGISLSRAAKLWYNALIELERLHSEMNHGQPGRN